jgi:hypothetical protein
MNCTIFLFLLSLMLILKWIWSYDLLIFLQKVFVIQMKCLSVYAIFYLTVIRLFVFFVFHVSGKLWKKYKEICFSLCSGINTGWWIAHKTLVIVLNIRHFVVSSVLFYHQTIYLSIISGKISLMFFFVNKI